MELIFEAPPEGYKKKAKNDGFKKIVSILFFIICNGAKNRKLEKMSVEKKITDHQ